MNDSALLTAEPATAPGRSVRPYRWAVLLAAAVLLGYSVATARLHGDIRYVLACLRTGEATPSETFTHRPYFYRWFLWALDQLTFGPVAVREALLRLAGVGLCLAAGLLLRSALLRRMPAREATLTAAMAALALAFAPRTDFLQPEWTAVVFSVAAVAAVLAVERPVPAAALGALPLGLAVMMKYSTLATAVIALLVVFAADRVRALLLAVAGAAASALLLGASLVSGSREWQWVRDMPKINQGALSRQGLRPGALFDHSVDFLADRAVLSPVVVLLPAALLLLLAGQPDRRRRAEWAVVALACGVVCLGAVVVQGNWFAYHAAALPVGAAAVWGLAVGRWYGSAGRLPVGLVGVTVALAVLGPLYGSAPPGVQRSAVVWGAALAAVAATVVDLRAARTSGPASRLPAFAVLAGVLCLAVTVWPGSPHLMARGKVQSTNAAYLRDSDAKQARADRIRDRLPAGAPVQYLVFGDDAYFIGHPTPCRYPVPTFLQRTRYLPDVAGLDSYAENARCLDADPPRYAVLQRAWFPLDRIDQGLARRIEEVYDCPQAGPKDLVVCRLR
ncbi:hypothetical protein AB0M28_30445 [Streptomyces sp. NPDC051940]|uniref:hypothetical protein n=1 Tax=Streptomyces sp. NPDC051940 TaxID=3155675 RepID=UPI003436CCD3